ncbi:MAG: hypothetical protein ABI432_06295, partial [Flavobacteriales bacterium]
TRNCNRSLCYFNDLGSNASRRPSPKKLMPSTVRITNSAGKKDFRLEVGDERGNTSTYSLSFTR